MDGKSLDLTAEKLAQLRDLFPEVFSEGKVDFARLKDMLGEHVVFPNEHYELSWAGKAEARKEIQKQTTNTLIADKEGSIDFENAQNLFIEGENLEVLRILQKSYFGKVKMIYIDPPYNTGNDSFVYPDDFSERQEEYKKRAGITDEEGYLNKQDLWRKNTRENGQFHSVWLSMMYPRLYLARNLLREDGVIFVSIDDNEVNNLKLIMDEIYGEENHYATFAWQRKDTPSNDTKDVSFTHEYVLCFARSSVFQRNLLPRTEAQLKNYKNPDNDPRGLWIRTALTRKEYVERDYYAITNPKGRERFPPKGTSWRVSRKTLEWLKSDNRLWWGESNDGDMPFAKRFLSEVQDGVVPTTWWDYEFAGSNRNSKMEMRELFNDPPFDTPKPTKLITRILEISTDSDQEDIVLDFFAGSGTTAHALLRLNEEDGGNRQFICVQMPELLEENSEAYKAGYRTIADISKARITKVIEKLQKARAEQLALESKPQILGFRSFKIAPSNFKNWRGDAEGEELLKQLDFLKQSEKDGSLHENMLVELLLKSGLALTAKVETLKAGKAEAYLVEDGRLFLFFGGYNKSIKELIHEKTPQRVVCLDSAFKGKDEDISNFKLELKEAGIELTIL